jgi:hypothetical protein
VGKCRQNGGKMSTKREKNIIGLNFPTGEKSLVRGRVTLLGYGRYFWEKLDFSVSAKNNYSKRSSREGVGGTICAT